MLMSLTRKFLIIDTQHIVENRTKLESIAPFFTEILVGGMYGRLTDGATAELMMSEAGPTNRRHGGISYCKSSE